MAELSLEPYAVVQRWQFQPPGRAIEAQSDAPTRGGLPASGGSAPAPEALLKAYLERLAAGCQAAGNCVIGHIKALALFPDHSYLRGSVVAAHLPATLDGAAPPGCTTFELTLNLLVYGLLAARLADITHSAAQALMQTYPLTIERLAAPQGANDHAHTHG